MAIAITMLRLSLGMVTASRLAQVSLIRPGRMMTFRFEEGGEGMTDTDRELLEWAAKAAGVELEVIIYSSGNYDAGFWTPYAQVARHSWNCWDPLKDDGDALRLAVKLKIELKFPVFYNDPDCDRYAVTRQEIVKAAAEIGRRMA